MQGLKEAMNRLEVQKMEALGPLNMQEMIQEESIAYA